jgi:protein-disulfide isomerase
MTEMNRLRSVIRFGVAAAVVAMTLPFATASLMAQRSVPKPNEGETFKDTSMLKPPAGAKIAIIEFEDMECPMCAHVFPIVHAAAEHYNIPLIQHDFPLPYHIWSLDAMIWARYLQDKVSPKTGDEYRGAVFAAQTGIASKDDMLNFTRRYFQSHGLQLPFVPDPAGQFKKEVEADRTLGDRLGVQYTPAVIVCTQKEWVHVTDVSLLYQTIDELEAKVRAEAPAKKAATAPAKRAATAPAK